MSRLLPLLLAFMLAACWTGPAFYAASESERAVPAGIYELRGPSGPLDDRIVQVTHLPDGFTQLAPVSDPSESTTVGLVPLPGARGVFVIWFAAVDGDLLPEGQTFYGLLGSEEDGGFGIYFPTCAEHEEVPAGAERVPDKFPQCRFADRASLEEALRRHVPRIGEGGRLVHVRRAR